MSTTATELPESFAAGTTVLYRRTHADYPASAGWALVLYLAGPSVVNVAGAAVGDAFDVALSAVQTAGLLPGSYTWVERVTKGAEKYDAEKGTVTVLPDLATAGAGDLQTWEEKTLTILNAAIAGQLTSGMASYQIAGRAVSKIPMGELLRLRNQLTAAIARRARGGKGRTRLAIFTGAGFDR